MIRQFDPQNREHMDAYRCWCEDGYWPESVEIKERNPITGLWIVLIQAKLAQAWSDYEKDA